MTESVSPKERGVAFSRGVTERDYIARREQYAAEHGTTVAALIRLNESDLDVISKTGVTPEQYLQSSHGQLANDVINYTGRII